MIEIDGTSSRPGQLGLWRRIIGGGVSVVLGVAGEVAVTVVVGGGSQ